jgi:predicted esterase
MALLRRDFGTPEGAPSLWISMHGGGGTTTETNDGQWRNQIRLYQPEEGIYLAPRAPSDTWNMWHRPEVDALFDRLIESAVIAWGVDPNRVYLMGYSAGGDGVYQLAPRMADRFAAAAMMAGHPNNARPEGLRNLPFAIFMGGEDSAFNRNGVAQQWADRLAELQSGDPEGYTHSARIYPGLPHWMNGEDAEGVPWMAAHTRDPWPRAVVWRQGNTPHRRFYWLAVPETEAVADRAVRASVHGQTITLESEEVNEVHLLLSDVLIDLDEPITVIANGREVFRGRPARTEQAIAESIRLRSDPAMIATAVVRVRLTED